VSCWGVVGVFGSWRRRRPDVWLWYPGAPNDSTARNEEDNVVVGGGGGWVVRNGGVWCG
jgi:hypothetical protein